MAAISQKQPIVKKRRGSGRPFTAGLSGNPTGRPKKLGELTDLARQHTKAAIEALVRGLEDPRHYPSCAQELLNRAWGKAPQTFEHTGEEGGPVRMVVSWQKTEE